MPIHLDCPNGHPLRLKDKMAGKRGVCPKCGAGFVAPPAAIEAPPLPATVSPAAAPNAEAVEWSAATPDGQRFGPTVPTLFARWIAEGRVSTDTLVWRTGWPEWRRAGDAEADLPAPLPEGAIGNQERETEPPDAIPQFETKRSPKSGAASYAARRRRQAQQRRNFTIALAVACLLLIAMLLWMVAT